MNIHAVVRKAACRWVKQNHMAGMAVREGSAETEDKAAVCAAERDRSGSDEGIHSRAAEDRGVSVPEDAVCRTDRMLAEFVEARYDLRYNLLTEVTELRRRDERHAAFHPVTEREQNGICLAVHREGIPCWDRDLQRYFRSTRIPVWHPFRSYFETLPAWDGRDRLEALARRVSDDALWVGAFHRWMLGVAAQWSGVGDGLHGLSVAPLLVSDVQGLGKSTFCRALMPPELSDYYADNVDLSNPGRMERLLVETGLLNLDEFDRITARRQPMLKNLMQLSRLNIRKAYRHHSSALPRLAAFIGTSNSRDLLTDASGSRRFICVSVEHPIDSANIDHAQIYAQLKAELARGARHWFSKEEEAALQRNNAQYYRIVPAEELVRRFFRAARPDESCTPQSLSALYLRLHRLAPGATAGITQQHLAQALMSVGIRKVHTQAGNRYRVVEVRAEECLSCT